MELHYSNDLCSAFVAEIVAVFREQFPSGFLGRTAIQKLAYFCQVTGVPIPCPFEIYNYGPYSDEMKFAVDSLIADEVIEDKSQKATYSNYYLCLSPAPFDSSLLELVSRFRKQVENVVAAMGQFSPSTLELVATLHFIASRRRSLDRQRPVRPRVIEEFKSIKGDKFSDRDISSWYDALECAQLI